MTVYDINRLKELREFYGDGSHGERQAFEKVYSMLARREIPERWPEAASLESPYLDIYRRIFIQAMGYCLVARSWIVPLAEFLGKGRCLEVMAGTGALSKALMDEGVDVFPTDSYLWSATYDGFWTKVKRMDCLRAVRRYGKHMDYVVLSWPYMNETAYKLLLEMRKVNPRLRMIYIGEWAGGAFASDAFFNAAKILPEPMLDAVNAVYRPWHGNGDKVWLLK